MSRSKINRAGAWVLGVGILMLVTGLLLTMTVGTVLVPILVTGSVVVNSVGITMLRHGKDRDNKDKTKQQRGRGRDDRK